MRILYTTTVGGTMNFFKLLIKKLVDEGNTIDIATNESTSVVSDYYRELGCNIYPVSWSRTPLDSGNIKAIKELTNLIKDGNYDIVHCHTPIASFCTKLACRRYRKNGLKVIYTAHGFHFCRTTPKKNWILFFPLEYLCSYLTDVLITINKEDFELARRKLHAKHTKYVPGVGVDINRFKDVNINREKKRAKFGIGKEDVLFLSVGELTPDKNHILMLEALKRINNPNYKYIICGEGKLRDYLQVYIHKNGLSNNVLLLGRRNDIPEMLCASDVFAFPSVFEGLPVSLMEAIATKKPIVCSNSRGNTDLINDKKWMFEYNDVSGLIKAIEYVLSNDSSKTIEENFNKLDTFSAKNVINIMEGIYENYGNWSTFR